MVQNIDKKYRVKMTTNKYYKGTPSNVRGTNRTLLQQKTFPTQFSHCGKHGLDNLIEEDDSSSVFAAAAAVAAITAAVVSTCPDYRR
jgi:hypothetical protein